MISGSPCATSELNTVDDFQSDERWVQIGMSLETYHQYADPCGLGAYTLIAVQAPEQLIMSHDTVWAEDSH